MPLKHRLLLFVAGSGCFIASGYGQNLITNGGFETAPPQGSGNNNPTSPAWYSNYVGAAQVAVQGWTFGMNNNDGSTARVEWYTATAKESWNTAPSSTGGNFALELNSDSTTDHLYAQQAVSLTSAKAYQLTLDIAPESAFSTGPYPSLTVLLLDGTGRTANVLSTLSFTVTQAAWKTVTANFVAPAGVAAIRFLDTPPASNNQSNIEIDNISLRLLPEPGAFASALALIIGVGVIERKRLGGLLRQMRLKRTRRTGLGL